MKTFIANDNIQFNNVPEFKQIVKLDQYDDSVELIPEAYMETDYSTLKEEDFIRNMKKYVLFSIINGD